MLVIIRVYYLTHFSPLFQVFSETDLTVQEEKCNLYSGLFAILGVAAFIFIFIRVGKSTQLVFFIEL